MYTKRICAWCKMEMEPLNHANENPQLTITHGICHNCLEEFDSEKISIEEYINRFDVPILVIKNNIRVKSANQSALELLGKPSSEVIDELSGDVVECLYSKHPNGCGSTKYCKGCVLRDSITNTFSTGECELSVISNQKRLVNSEVADMKIQFSTQKIKDLVLLHIEDMSVELKNVKDVKNLILKIQ